MRIEKALQIRDRAAHAIADLFSTAAHFGLTHAVMLDRRDEIYARCNVQKAPHWVKSYLNGVWDVHQKFAYRDSLVFGGMVDGKFYSTHSNRDDYYEKNGIEPRDYADDGRVTARGHYWVSTFDGQVRPFFNS